MAGFGEIPSITTTRAPLETKAASSLPPVPDSRNQFLESIRQGVKLKVSCLQNLPKYFCEKKNTTKKKAYQKKM